MKAADIQSTLPLSVESPSTERDHWRTVPLRDVIFHPDYGVTASATPEPVGPKFLRITDIGKPTIDWDRVPHCRCSDREKEEKQLRNGDLVVARIGATTGITYLYRVNDVPAVFASYLIRIRCRETFSPEFLYQISQSPLYWDQVDSIKQGRLKEGINTEELKSLMIPLPPLSEQHRIATVLATVDEAIAVTDQIITQVQQFKNELLNRVFSQSWPSVKIDDIKADRRNAISLGPFGSDLVSKDYVESGVPVLRGKNLSSLKINFDNLVFVTEEKADQLRSSNVFANDIIITYRGTLGQVSLLSNPFPWPRCVISQSLMKVSCNEQVALPEYILQYLISPKGQQQILGCKGHTGVPALGNPVTSIKQFQIPLPPLAKQQQIAHLLSTVDDRLALERAERDRLVALKKGLMQVLLTGKVRVPPGVAEEVAPAHA